MKSEYFNKRSQSSQLRGHREKPKPKQINWDRIVYFVLLILILGFLSYYLFLNTFYVSGEGLVVTETVKIKAPEDMEIQEQLVSRNSYIGKGEPLFRYTLMNWTDTTDDEIEKLAEDITDEQEQIEELEDDVTLQRQSIREIQDRIAFLEQKKENFLEKVRLNAATSYEVDEVESSLFNARSNLRQAQSELNVLANNLNRHIQNRNNLQENLQELESGDSSLKTYYSPVSGRVYNISVSDNQQAFRSDPIVSIKPDRADVYIFSVFDREDAEYIQPGTVMKIEFDNGQESEGVIRSSYDARENLIDHFEQTGSLTTEYSVVEVVPIDSTTRAQWLDLDRSGLSIYRKKVGRKEVNPPDQNMGRSDSDISSVENGIEEDNRQSMSDSNVKENEKNVTAKPSESSDDELVEPIGDAKINQIPEKKDSEYGLKGDSFYDQLTGYSINLYTFEDKIKASHTSKEMKKEGYRVNIHEVTINDQNLWRVSVGQFKTIEDARMAAESLPATLADNYFINRLQ